MVDALVPTSQGTTTVLKLIHAHGWESSGSVVLSFVVVDLMDWHSSVHNMGLDRLLVNDRLNCLVNVVMDMLASYGGHVLCLMLGLSSNMLVLVLSLSHSKLGLCIGCVSVVMGPVLYWDNVVMVLLWQDFSIMHRLHSRVVVILVDLSVGRDLSLIALVWVDSLVLDTWVDMLVHRSVVLSRLGNEVRNCGLSFLHFDG